MVKYFILNNTKVSKLTVPYPFKDDRVLVIGVGNSGIDIASELTSHATELVLSSRSGNWVVPKTTFFGLPTDHLSTRACNSLPSALTNFALESLLRVHQGDLANFKLKPKHRFNESPPVVGTQVLQYIDSGKIIVKPNIAKFVGGKAVAFEDGKTQEFDTVICCTGYKVENSFIKERMSNGEDGKVKLYRFIFPTDSDTIGFIGLVQSTISTLPVAEMQARWANAVFANKVKLPAAQERIKLTEDAYREQLSRFGSKDRNSIAVDHIAYQDLLATDLKCKPDLYRLWKWQWGNAIRLTFGPALAAQYRLYGPNKWTGAENEILDACSHFDIYSIIASFRSGSSAK